MMSSSIGLPKQRQPIRYWIGVDGGGSHTRARVCDGTGRPLGEGSAGPSALGQGVMQAWAHVHEAVAAAAAGLGTLDWNLCALGLGLSGTELPQATERFLQAAPPCAVLVLDSDAWIGLLGAHGGAAGALLIAGTGSIGMALAADGSRRTVGGWGWVHGDEGSGAWLGLAALRHAERALDGRERRGALASAVLAEVGLSRAALLAWQQQGGQSAHASLAPLVFEYEEADPCAATLVQTALDELVLAAQALDPEARLPLALAGSVARRLTPRLATRLERLGRRCVPAQADAMAGALQLIHAPAPIKVPH